MFMEDLVRNIAKALVDNPDEVQVSAVEGEQTTVVELRVDPEDLGKVIGVRCALSWPGATNTTVAAVLSDAATSFPSGENATSYADR